MSCMKKGVLLFVICINCICLQAQSVEDVQKIFPDDHAVILNNNRNLKLYFKDKVPVAETMEQTHILVLNDKANGIYNKYKVFHGSFDELRSLEAYTNVPEGNKYKKLKVTEIKTQNATSRGVFYDDSKESVFDFPSLFKGAIATEMHTEFHKDPHLLSPFYFTSYMPVVQSKFTVSFPSDMQVKYIIKNNINNAIQVTEKKSGRQTVYEFTATNQKSRQRYGDGPSAPYYEPHVIIHLASYKNDHNEQVGYLGNVDDLYKWNQGFLNEINTQASPLLKHLADSLTTGLSTDKQKTKQVYNWVQNNIKYIAFEDGLEGFVPRQAADVCTKRYGDCKDMASLITALLKLAGLNAYFTWIGTRDIPYDYTEVPLPITDNHMISTMSLDRNNLTIIDTGRRKVAVSNDFKFETKNYTQLMVPAGYEVSYMPANYHYKNAFFDYDVKYLQTSGHVTAVQEFKSNVMLLEPKDFNQWNETVKELNIQQKNQVVLKRK